jgi:hypothetical protein
MFWTEASDADRENDTKRLNQSIVLALTAATIGVNVPHSSRPTHLIGDHFTITKLPLMPINHQGRPTLSRPWFLKSPLTIRDRRQRH